MSSNNSSPVTTAQHQQQQQRSNNNDSELALTLLHQPASRVVARAIETGKTSSLLVSMTCACIKNYLNKTD
jgi:hypothetical protein